MEHEPPEQHQRSIEKNAERAKLIIYLVMGIFMVLPLILALLMGAFRF